MKTKITYEDLIKMKPCYHPREIGIKRNYSAAIPEFIKEYRDKVQDKADILWVICRNDYMTARDIRLFAVWCAREALKLVKNPDPRSINACDVAERYADEEATKEELDAASAAAKDADRDAAGTASWNAAMAATMAAGDVAWATRDTWAAARAAGDAAGDAMADRDTAKAAWAIAWTAQTDKLLTYFE